MLLTRQGLFRRTLATVLLFYLTAGLWMCYLDATAFRETLEAALTGIDLPGLTNEGRTTPSNLKALFAYARPRLLWSMTSSTRQDEDIFVVFRTSATTIWRRSPIYLSTLLIEPRRYQIYSDQKGSIAGHEVIDVLEHLDVSTAPADLEKTTQEVRKPTPYSYRDLELLPTDELQGADTWKLNGSRLIPELSHAHASTQGRSPKWYLVLDDDTYVFWNNVQQVLESYNPQESIALGPHHALARGGSGMLLSEAAMNVIIGDDDLGGKRWSELASQQGNGGQALEKLFRDRGVKIYQDNATQMGFEAVLHRDLKFTESNWNMSILSVRKVQPRDVSDLFELEMNFMRRKERLSYGELFRYLIWPHIGEQRECWENGASEQVSLRPDAWALSAQACEQSCNAWQECLMWHYEEDSGCRRDSTIALGSSQSSCDTDSVSGWIRERVAARFMWPFY